MNAKGQPERFVEKIEDIQKRIEGKLARHGTEDSRPNEDVVEELRRCVEELRVAGEELCHQNEKLAREHQRYADLFNFALDANLVTDSAGNIQEANLAAGRLLHYAQDFLIGKPLVVFVTAEEHGVFRNRLIALRTGGVGRVEEWRLTLKPHNGTPFHVAMTVGAIRDSVSRLIGLRWVIRALPGQSH